MCIYPRYDLGNFLYVFYFPFALAFEDDIYLLFVKEHGYWQFLDSSY